MGTEQFSLCWDNFHSNMSSGLNALLKSEDLVDVTLAAEGRYIKAHKMVLSVCSPYFRELFSVNPCKHPIVFLKDVSYAALNSLLEFMYQGEVKVSQDDLGMFIKTAEALKIKGLTGDGSNSSDMDDQPEIVQPSTPVVETSLVKRPVPSVDKPQQPVRKKMLGPASKRFKPSEPLVKEPQFRQEEVDVQPSPLEPNIQFKMEPEETILDQPDASFNTSQADDSSMDNSLVYMMESSKLDQKAGTSSTSELNDAAAENQEMLLQIIQGTRGSAQLVVANHLYIKNSRVGERTFWKCTLYDRGLCKARCSTKGDKVFFSAKHTHEPNVQKIQGRTVLSKMLMKPVFASKHHPFDRPAHICL